MSPNSCFHSSFFIFFHENAILKEFKKLKTKKKLQEFVKKCNNILASININKTVTSWVESADNHIPIGLEGTALLRSVAQCLLDYGYDKSRKMFPFTRPYLELYNIIGTGTNCALHFLILA
jgi:hypothetical protein